MFEANKSKRNVRFEIDILNLKWFLVTQRHIRELLAETKFESPTYFKQEAHILNPETCQTHGQWATFKFIVNW